MQPDLKAAHQRKRDAGHPQSPPAATALPTRSPSVRSPFVEFLGRESSQRTLAVVLDVCSAAAAIGLALWWTPGPTSDRGISTFVWVFVPTLILVLSSRSMYRRKLSATFLDDFEALETSVAVSVLATLTFLTQMVPPLAVGQVVGQFVRPSDVIVRLWLCAAVVVPGVRLLRSIIQRYWRRKYRVGAPTLIVGSDQLACQLIGRMLQVPDYGLRPVGVLDDNQPHDCLPPGVPYLGTTDDLETAVQATGARKLIVAPSTIPDERLALTAQRAHDLGLRVRAVPRLMDAVGRNARVEHLGGVPLMVLDHVDPRGWQFAVKHLLDRVIAAFCVVLALPMFIALALAVRLTSPGPIMFRQQRVGRDGKVFDCLKFRSMRPLGPGGEDFRPDDGTAPGGVEGEDRRTWVGKIMRRASLDELPQLFNVLRGDMSIVGPRPERPDFVHLFETQVRRYGQRHRVKAGMTGWAQVHGLRGRTSIADRAEFDNFYVENWSLNLDFQIILLTALAVIRSPDK